MYLRISKFSGEIDNEITEANVIWTALAMDSPDYIKKQQWCL